MRRLGVLAAVLLAGAAAAQPRLPQDAACEAVMPPAPLAPALEACSWILEHAGRTGAARAEDFVRRGFVRAMMGDAVGALADSSAALTLDPGNRAARDNRASMRAALGDLVGARADLDLLIAAAPAHPRALRQRAIVLLRLGLRAEARADLEAAIAESRADEVALMLRGDPRREEADAAGALEDYAAALAIHPGNAAVRARLAMLLFHLGQRDRAAAEIAAAQDLARPGDPFPFAAAAGLALLMGDAAQAAAAGGAADAAAARAIHPATAEEAERLYGLALPGG